MIILTSRMTGTEVAPSPETLPNGTTGQPSDEHIQALTLVHPQEALETALKLKNQSFGVALHTVPHGEHLCELAHPGQVLLSAGAVQAVRPSLPERSSLVPLGVHRLRDLLSEEPVFQLNGPGESNVFPPVLSLDTLPNNLPAQITRFVGRERELASWAGLLSQTRLLSLIGTAGIGKTRLAVHLAAQVLDRFPEGAWLVELSHLRDPSLLPRTIASALGIQEESNEALIHHLRNRRLLLLLDNCEPILEVAGKWSTYLLQKCPHMSILVTSREPLGIPGEVTRTVVPLPVPPIESPLPAREFGAVQLFVDRASAVIPTLTITEENAMVLGQICRQLGGVPLAIEVVAPWSRALTPAQILEQLQVPGQLLSLGGPAEGDRHISLRTALDWSYLRLSAPAQTLLYALSVFSGSFPAEAVEATCRIVALGPQGHRKPVMELVEKSLVLAEEHSGSLRYRILEPTREYGLEKLQESGQEAAVRDCHRDWCLQWADEATALYKGPHQAEAVRRLEQQHDDVRMALWWCRSRGNTEALSRLAWLMGWFWDEQGCRSEGRRWLETALSDWTLRDERRINLLSAAGRIARSQADLDTARSYFEESLDLARELVDPYRTARALSNLASVLLNQGFHDRAKALFEEALHIAREHPSGAALAATVRFNLAWVEEQHGRTERAETLCRETLDAARIQGNRDLEGTTLGMLGRIALRTGDVAMATQHQKSALAHHSALRNKPRIVECLVNLAGVAAFRQQHDRVAYLLAAASQLQKELAAPMKPFLQTEFHRLMSAVRAQLGDASCDLAFAAVHSWQLTQLVNYALREESTELKRPSAPVKEPVKEPVITTLTARELEVVRQVAQGGTYEQIARVLFISENTVDKHLQNITHKLGITRKRLAEWAFRNGVIGSP